MQRRHDREPVFIGVALAVGPPAVSGMIFLANQILVVINENSTNFVKNKANHLSTTSLNFDGQHRHTPVVDRRHRSLTPPSIHMMIRGQSPRIPQRHGVVHRGSLH
ncbi:hypothetical protein I4U23_021907 [Adineta vaga]|nr:hypothetical protein I4U23_021907 [Adineta vaga]